MLTGRKAIRKTPTTLRAFKCRYCGACFECFARFQRHNNRHKKRFRTKKTDTIFKCKYCHKGFAYESNCMEHTNMHPEAKLYQCRFCEKTFKTEVAWGFHMHMRTPRCTKCGKYVTARTQHEKVLQCRFCHTVFTDERSLRMCSMKKAKNFQCEHCPKACTTQQGLTLHIKMVHKDRVPVKHDYCRKLAIPEQVKDHIRSQQPVAHKGGQPFGHEFLTEFAINELVKEAKKEHEKSQQESASKTPGQSSSQEHADSASKVEQTNEPGKVRQKRKYKRRQPYVKYQVQPPPRRVDSCKGEYFKEIKIPNQIKEHILSRNKKVPRIPGRGVNVTLEQNKEKPPESLPQVPPKRGRPPKQEYHMETPSRDVIREHFKKQANICKKGAAQKDYCNKFAVTDEGKEHMQNQQQIGTQRGAQSTMQEFADFALRTEYAKQQMQSQQGRVAPKRGQSSSDYCSTFKVTAQVKEDLLTQQTRLAPKRGWPRKPRYYNEMARNDLVKQHLQLQGKVAQTQAHLLEQAPPVEQDYSSKFAAKESLEQDFQSPPSSQVHALSKFTVTESLERDVQAPPSSQVALSKFTVTESEKQQVQSSPSSQVATPSKFTVHESVKQHFESPPSTSGQVALKGGRQSCAMEQEYASLDVRTTEQPKQSQHEKALHREQSSRQEFYNKYANQARENTQQHQDMHEGSQSLSHQYTNFPIGSEQSHPLSLQISQQEKMVPKLGYPFPFPQEYPTTKFAELTEQVREHIINQKGRVGRQERRPFDEYADFAMRTEQTKRLIMQQSQQVRVVEEDFKPGYFLDCAHSERLARSHQQDRESYLYQCKQCKVRFEHLRLFQTHMCCLEDIYSRHKNGLK